MARLEGGTAHSEIGSEKQTLIIVGGLVAYTTTHTRIESGWRIFAAPASLFTLTVKMSGMNEIDRKRNRN